MYFRRSIIEQIVKHLYGFRYLFLNLYVKISLAAIIIKNKNKHMTITKFTYRTYSY